MAISEKEAAFRRRANLSWGAIKRQNPDWNDIHIQDYLDKQQEISTLSTASLTLQQQVDLNTQTNDAQQISIDSNTAGVNNNAVNITALGVSVGNNAVAIVANTNSINANAVDIGNNATAISNNATAIGNNTTNITTVTNNFNSHNGSSSQHGVTGDNVGTEDYAQSSTGGVVLLAALTNDAVASTVSVTSADATDLPTVLTLANEMKGDVNQLVTDLNAAITQINDIIAKAKTAKQMST